MKHRALATIAALCMCVPAWAQFMQAEGRFASQSLQVQVILLDDEAGVAAVSASVVSGACSGTVSGTGQIHGHVLVITPYKKITGGESCRLELEFDKPWKQIKATGRSCQVFSGAACGFEGQTARKRNEG
jgi:hypothetical protein